VTTAGKELRDRRRVRRDPLGQPALPRTAFRAGEVVRFQLFRATEFRVALLHMDYPDVVGLDRQLAKDIFDGLAHEASDPALMLRLHLRALRKRHAEHAHGDLPRQGPVDVRRPDQRADALVVDRAAPRAYRSGNRPGMLAVRRGRKFRQASKVLATMPDSPWN